MSKGVDVYLDWEKIWKKFNTWYEKGELKNIYYEWPDQCKRVEMIVEKEVDKIVASGGK
jgi:hypothetical protein